MPAVYVYKGLCRVKVSGKYGIRGVIDKDKIIFIYDDDDAKRLVEFNVCNWEEWHRHVAQLFVKIVLGSSLVKRDCLLL